MQPSNANLPACRSIPVTLLIQLADKMAALLLSVLPICNCRFVTTRTAGCKPAARFYRSVHLSREGSRLWHSGPPRARVSWRHRRSPDFRLPRFQHGATTEITFIGSDLESAGTLWTSFPADAKRVGVATDEKVTYRIAPAKDVSVGVYGIRLFASNGVSNLRLVMIDDLPSAPASETNGTREAAQPLTWPIAVNGACNEQGFDYFKIHAAKGQRVSIEIVAARLGSRLDSVLRVLDAKGRELAYNDDGLGLRGDSRIAFQAPDAADYLIEVRDVNYGGGSEFSYRLRVGTFPFAITAFPLAAEQGTTARFDLIGPDMPSTRITAGMPTNTPVLVLAAPARQGAGSGFARVLASQITEALEQEPNDTPAGANKVSLSAAINGRFEKLKDRDWFEFSLSKKQRLTFKAQTRSLGSPCDVAMQLHDADGKKLAQSNVSSGDEGTLTHNFTEPGKYRLLIEEATSASGPLMNYRIEAEEAAGYALTLDNDKVDAARGGHIRAESEHRARRLQRSRGSRRRRH
jgi:hypothetical protein